MAAASSAWSCAHSALNSHSVVRRSIPVCVAILEHWVTEIATQTWIGRVGSFDPAEQEEQADVGTPERVALEVEEHVAVVGRGHRREADRFGLRRRVQRGGRRVHQLERRRGVGVLLAGGHLQLGLADETVAATLVQTRDLPVERGEAGDRVDAARPQRQPVGRADTGDVDERVGCTPLRLAHHLELAELAVVARLGERVDDRRRIDQLRQLTAQAAPVREHVVDADRLDLAGPEGDPHMRRLGTGERGERLGVEAQLQDVSRLRLVAGELGVDRLVGHRTGVGIDGAHEEVGDAADPVVDERHLEHDVVTVGHRIADPLDPRRERLAALLVLRGHLEHGEPLRPVAVEHGGLVVHPLLQQQRRHLTERAALDRQRARVDLVLQGEEVCAVEPRRDLRRCQESFHDETSVVRRWVIPWEDLSWLTVRRTSKW